MAGVAATEGATRLLSLPGAGRRDTGSYEVASGDPARVPATIWLFDSVPEIFAARSSCSTFSAMASAERSTSVSSLCGALDLPLSVVLREVSDLVALEESLVDTASGVDVVASAA